MKQAEISSEFWGSTSYKVTKYERFMDYKGYRLYRVSAKQINEKGKTFGKGFIFYDICEVDGFGDELLIAGTSTFAEAKAYCDSH